MAIKKLTALFLTLAVLLSFAGCKIETPEQHAGGGSSLRVESLSEGEGTSAASQESAESKTLSSGDEETEGSSEKSKPLENAPHSSGKGNASSPRENGSPTAQSVSSTSASSAPASSQTADTPAPKQYTALFSIDCINAMSYSGLSSALREILPANGLLLPEHVVTFTEGESVYDVLLRESKANAGLTLSTNGSAKYGTIYVETIANLTHKACGTQSGWMYLVNGTAPGVGCSGYRLKNGDRVQWRYTLDLGNDVK